MPRLVQMDDAHFTIPELEARVAELEGYDRLTNAQNDELARYRKALDAGHAEAAQSRARLADAVARHETGDQFVGETVNPHAPAPGVRRGRGQADDQHRLTAHGLGGELRDQARRRLDSLRVRVPDASMDLVTRTFERAEADPDGQELDLLSRWLVVTSDPAYGRACNRMFRDPANGNREFDVDELRAWRAAQAVNRNMNEGTGAAGAFLVPFHLDPTILLTNVGAVDPVRALAR